MTAGTALLGLGLLALVVLYLARPFLRKRPADRPQQTKRAWLLNQKEAIMTQILSLEFDFETGRIPDEIYEEQRTEMIAEAAVLLQELEETPTDNNIVAEIEAAIARLRETGTLPTTAPTAVGSGGFCPNCGSGVDKNDKFCANCGHSLVAPMVEAAH